MKYIDMFLIRNVIYSYSTEPNICFLPEQRKGYYYVDAVIRTRCYDIIKEFWRKGICAELYKSHRKYEIVIVTKFWSNEVLHTVQKLKEEGANIIYDAFYDDWGNPNRIHEEENVISIAKLADAVITVSDVQKRKFLNWNDFVVTIPESIHRKILNNEKQHYKKEVVTLIFIGYAKKAQNLHEIKDVINELINTGKCKLLCVTEKDPELSGVKYDFIKYDQRNIAKQMLMGDIAIAPRSMKEIENASNSIMKVAMPMAVGLPVAASPVPSYKGLPIILCENHQQWLSELESLVESEQYRADIGIKGKKYVENNITTDRIADRYRKVIEQVLVRNTRRDKD